MPAFTFEKIAPPNNPGSIPAIATRQKGVLFQMLDRLVEARVKRDSPEENEPSRSDRKI